MNDDVTQQDAEVQAGRLRDKHLGGLLFLFILAVYGLLAPSFSVPGRWAGIATAFSGMDASRPLIRPLWSGLVAKLATLPVANLGYAVNLVGVLAGALSCWLIFEIVRRIPFSRTRWHGTRRNRERVPRLIAAFSAALFTAGSLPVMVSSTRGDFMITDILLLLLALYPVALYIERPRLGCLYASCAVMGLALVEYPTALLILPGYLVWWVILLWQAHLPKKSPYVLATSLLLSGLVVLTFYMAFSGGTAPVQAGEATIVTKFFRLYVAELTQSVPKVGWLLIIGLNLVPFVAVMFRELGEPEDTFTAIGVHSFRVVLVLVAIMTLFSLPGSPAHVIGRRAMLLAPSIIVAVWSGFLIGYFYLHLSDTTLHRNRRLGRRRKRIGQALVAAWLVLLVAAGVRHAGATRVDHLAPVVEFADAVVRHLDGRDFIITDGALDPTLKLAARRAGQRVDVINLQAGMSPEHGRHVAAMFDAPAMKSLALISVPALLRDWVTREPGTLDRLALLASPGLFRVPGVEAEPGPYFYRLRAGDTGGTDAAILLEQAEDAWRTLRMPALDGMDPGDDGWFQSLFITRWLSRLANDIGFLLDAHAQPDLAAEAYRKAVALWPDNISATLNLREQAIRLATGEEEVVTEQLRAQLARNPAAMNNRYLQVVCGWLSNPSAMIDQAGGAGPGGLTDEVIRQLTTRISEDDAGSMMNLARLYLRGARAEEGEAIYQSLLETNPQNLDAHYGLYQVAMTRGNHDEALARLEIMAALGADEKKLRIDRAATALAARDLEKARALYVDIVRDPSAPAEAWFGLAQTGILAKDEDLIDTAFAALAKENAYIPGLLLLGERALLQRRVDEARGYFARVVALEPANAAALTRLLQIAFGDRNAGAIRQHAGALLAIAPDHPFANFMSAYVHIDAERYDLAEAALRRSLAVREDAAALNELAWVLARQEKLEEALVHATRAVEVTPGNFNAWDTLAEIQSKLGRRDEALVSIEKALSLDRNNSPNIILHAAELHHAAGQSALARALILLVDASDSAVSDDVKTRRAALLREIGP